ncbi:MAG: serine protease [Bacteroidaceae bacterium]|nr:serine protease [Bacteroidaceae bacterium]
MRNIYTLILLLGAMTFIPSHALAQKWMKKARKAQVNVLTYDAQGRLLHSTNGFQVGDDGTVVSDYSSFKDAVRAVVIDEKGKEYPVDRLTGANSLYDVVKLQVGSIKPNGLKPASAPAAKDQSVFIMPYLGNKSETAKAAPVTSADVFNEKYYFYTLGVAATEKQISCPVMNEDGEVLGLLQNGIQAGSDKCYVVDIAFVSDIKITALSATSNDYRSVLIQNALPDDASQASSFIYLIGKRDTSMYMAYVEDFIQRFPSATDGYIMKAEALSEKKDYSGADAAWTAGLDKAKSKLEEIHASTAQSIYKQAQSGDSLPENWSLERAFAEAEEAYRINPLPSYIVLQAHILYSRKEYSKAAEKFLAACSTNLRSPEQFLYAAQCLSMKGDTLGVLAMQDSAVAMYSKPYIQAASTPLLMRANTLISLKRYREAVADLSEYEHLQYNNVNANFYYQREQCEMKCRMFQQALNDIERAVQMAPGEALYQAELAAVHYRLNQMDEAAVAARKAIEIDPEFADAHRILGLILRATHRENDAMKFLEKAVELGDAVAPSLLK